MPATPRDLAELSERVQALEAQNASLLETLKLLLPVALTIPATTPNSAEALRSLRDFLAAAEKAAPKSDDFWLLGSAMAMLLSSRALMQHPDDPEVQHIHHGIRAHRRH